MCLTDIFKININGTVASLCSIALAIMVEKNNHMVEENVQQKNEKDSTKNC